MEGNRKPDSVPYIVFESELARQERQIQRLWIALIISVFATLLVVGGFLLYLNQYEYVSNETVTVDGASGIANYIGKDGDIYNGEDYSKEDKDQTQEVRQEQGNNEA